MWRSEETVRRITMKVMRQYGNRIREISVQDLVAAVLDQVTTMEAADALKAASEMRTLVP